MRSLTAEAFVAACRAELEALKPGNVHRHGAGHGMTVEDFLTSAERAAPHIARRGAGVGERVLGAVEATRAAVGQNTNLGIVLLCAPLAAAAEHPEGPRGLWPALEAVLAGLTVEDARLAYRAIRLAGPGGLGRAAAADVAEEPRVTLLEAMRLAAERDRIAWNYAHGFADLGTRGLPRLGDLLRRWDQPWAVTGVFLAFLAAIPDTHVVRKHGAATAADLRERAAGLERRLLAAAVPAALEEELLAFDRELKAAGINPGTSADLTVATLFAHDLGQARPER